MDRRQRRSSASVRLEIAIIAVIGVAVAVMIRGCAGVG